MTDWYAKRKNETAGPLTQQRLKELVVQGKIQKSDLVKQGENGTFCPAGETRELILEFQDDDTETINSSREDFPNKNTSQFFIKLAITGISLYIVFVLVALFFTGAQQARDATQRSAIKKNLRQIGIALEKYHAKQIHKETQPSTSK